MKIKQGLVSIVLPVYNSEKYLSFCLESLIAQAYEDIEIIAVDDFSKDSSFKILQEFKKKDSRIKISKNKKRYGLAICLNRGLKKAKGEYINFVSPHDKSDKARIKKQLDFLKENPKVVAVGTQAVLVDHNNRKISETSFPNEHDDIYNALPRGLSMKFETVLINKKRLPRDILYFKNHHYPFIFVDVFIKFLQYGEVANLKDALYRYKKTFASKSTKKDNLIAFTKVFLKSIALYDYKLSTSIRNIFLPLLKT